MMLNNGKKTSHRKFPAANCSILSWYSLAFLCNLFYDFEAFFEGASHMLFMLIRCLNLAHKIGKTFKLGKEIFLLDTTLFDHFTGLCILHTILEQAKMFKNNFVRYEQTVDCRYHTIPAGFIHKVSAAINFPV